MNVCYMKYLSLLLSITKSDLLAKKVKMLAILYDNRNDAKGSKGHEFLNVFEEDFIFVE